jgi:hypothetical protein
MQSSMCKGTDIVSKLGGESAAKVAAKAVNPRIEKMAKVVTAL